MSIAVKAPPTTTARDSQSPVLVAMADTFIPVHALKGRGAATRLPHRFDRCFALIDPISMVSRRGAGGLIDRYIVERVEGAPGDIISAGCHAKIGHHQQ